MEFAKKKFGQNFITDKNLINKIVKILGEEQDHLVIEIGPGRGALTKLLCENYKKVIAVEIDRDLENILRAEIKNENFELIIGDILEIELSELIKNNKDNFKNISIISNTPYYITSEIIFRTLDVHNFLYKAVFMLQKEVATRICAKVNENNYNNLSIATQFYSDVKYEFTVNKKMFSPVPKVDSSVISLKFKDDYIKQIKDDKAFVKMVRQLFNNKRKTILNNLGTYMNNKELAKKILLKCNIEENLRPENISIEQFINLYNEQKN